MLLSMTEKMWPDCEAITTCNSREKEGWNVINKKCNTFVHLRMLFNSIRISDLIMMISLASLTMFLP